MESFKLPDLITSKKVEVLQLEIHNLEVEIKGIEQQLFPFEQSLRNAIDDLLIEESELTVLYKSQKKEKKEKRLAQKKRGKNYVAPLSLKLVQKEILKAEEKYHSKEKKRLYKETMLYVHPDKFSMHENEQERATAITTKLIEIYKTGSLLELQAYHSHIFNGNTSLVLKNVNVKTPEKDTTVYLKSEIERLKARLKELRNSYTYKVLLEYENPLSFVKELQEYYKDRIFKLKKRTRTK